MNKPVKTPIGISEIKNLLPHRYPFLLIDRVIDYTLEPERTLTAIKNVSINEPFFNGHFPLEPVMPGVLILEAMAQASGVLACLSVSAELAGMTNYMVKIDKARFSRKVLPGDQLLMQVTQKRLMRGMGLYECATTVDGERTASCEILSARG